MIKKNKPSKVEGIKDESNFLRGNIVDDLEADNGGKVSNETYELLKFHGSYFGFNRDTALERKKQKLDKEWEFMIRVKAPAGVFSRDQYLALDEMASLYANNSLRITTRQTFQFHCIAKQNLRRHINAINKVLLTTFGGCGDIVRNVTAVSAPIKDYKHKRLLEDAYKIDKFTMPKSKGYHEIWVDGKNVIQQKDDDNEPLYGKHYLPRKFKIGLIIPEDNSIDVLTNDLAFILVYEGQKLLGYNVYWGGGMGMTHNKPETYPRLATPICFVEESNLLRIVDAVVKLQRDYGDRTNRKHARLKYVVDEYGFEWGKKTLEQYYGGKLADVKDIGKLEIVEHMGWHSQLDGKFYLGIPIDSGRIIDNEQRKIKTGLRNIVQEYDLNLVMTADQNIILCDILPEWKDDIEAKLGQYNIALYKDFSKFHRNVISCVSYPTCGKALAEAERIQLPLTKQLESILQRLSIADEEIFFRISGCPNGCARPYTAEIAIVGVCPNHYAIYLGGSKLGTNLAEKIVNRVHYDNLVQFFDIMLTEFVSTRTQKESFDSYCSRVGVQDFYQSFAPKVADLVN